MYVFIVNPVAGDGRAAKLFLKIKQSTLYHETNSMHYDTKYPGHAVEIVQKMVTETENIACIIVVGGDGTLHEVMNGMGKANIPVSFIPGGSGNDFARGSSIKGTPMEIFQKIINSQGVRPYWLGNYQLDHHDNQSFVSNIGFGFDADIVRTANRSKYKAILNKLHIGKISYVIALIQVLFRFKPRSVELKIDGEKRLIQDCWMVTIANHPYYGGGMKIIPHATIQPDKFPVLVLHSISKWKVLGLFITIFSGKHIHFKEVELLEATTIEIYAKGKVNCQVDGQTAVCTSCIISKQSQVVEVMGTNERKEIIA
ncbi:YegS/Rv2252/BmrU family lipid kinase [Virgibacillus halotolerans]|uniref:diacylglycerol/lipid kinase family protein n=1 Tax=Virgibacillus halotolerans TaxID=1071053 RepID=UPI00196154A0|nr:diacylglycerol kinase family protein [Virgibacillus halotolerans]MBM7597650.1 YegS/Rv2252/BmrU family lipid kinase [Virgibacillus halotolerans]